MTRKVKYRFFIDYEKEERWVNDMAQQGWNLQKFMLIRYTFEKGEVGEYHYRNELIGSRNIDDYLAFLEDSGIEVVHTFGGWAYFRRKASEGPFELYSDANSKSRYYNRILGIFGLLLIVNLMLGIMNILIEGKDDTPNWYVNLSVGYLNIIASLILAIPWFKVWRRKKKLEEEQRLFHE